MVILVGVEAINRIADNYKYAWTIIDHRVDGWLLTSSGIPMLLCLFAYLIAAYYGPKFMLHRKPFHLPWILFVYNSVIAVLNLHIFKELTIVSYRHGYNYLCEPVRVSTDPDEMRIVTALHLYFVSKLIEFLDTVFIIIRKKDNQRTFLHIYHHSTMFFFCWIAIRWVPGGCAVTGAIINSFIHVIMYTYYGLSVMGPKVTKYLWWKRYLTVIQLVQFCIGLIIGTNGIFTFCDFPKWMHYANFIYMISYIVLFGRFYKDAYITKKTKKSTTNGHVLDREHLNHSTTNGVCKHHVTSKSATNGHYNQQFVADKID